MTNEYYDVIYHNDVAEEDRENLASSLSGKFKLSKEKALLLLATSQPVCLKKKINLSSASKYESALSSLQLKCDVVPHQDDDQKPFIEKRSGDDRRAQEDRRDTYRGNAIQPDRRQKDRRSTS